MRSKDDGKEDAKRKRGKREVGEAKAFDRTRMTMRSSLNDRQKE